MILWKHIKSQTVFISEFIYTGFTHNRNTLQYQALAEGPQRLRWPRLAAQPEEGGGDRFH